MLDTNKNLENELKRLDNLQKEFRNCFAVILLNRSDMVTWTRIQLKLGYCTVRLFTAETMEEASATIYEYYSMMKDTAKLKQQSIYFTEVCKLLLIAIVTVMDIFIYRKSVAYHLRKLRKQL